MKNKKAKAVLTAGRRNLIMAAGGFLALASALGLFLSLTVKTESTQETLYSYQVKADASYRVHLRPNTLYESQWLEEGGVYAEALADFIELSLTASHQGSEAAAVQGTYRIAVILEGSQGAEENSRPVFRKEFPLKEGMFPQAKGGAASIKEVLNIRPDTYREYAKQAEQILQNTVTKLCYLSFTGALTLSTAYGEKTQDFAYRLPLPLGTGTSFYQIVKPAPILAEDKITGTSERPVPVDIPRVAGAAAAGVAGLGLLIFGIFFTRPPDREELWQRRLREILRKYGDRMSRLKKLPDFAAGECLPLADMDSLVILAEETRSPLFYSPDEAQLPQDGLFYSPGDDKIYLFQLSRETTTLVVEEHAQGYSEQTEKA